MWTSFVSPESGSAKRYSTLDQPPTSLAHRGRSATKSEFVFPQWSMMKTSQSATSQSATSKSSVVTVFLVAQKIPLFLVSHRFSCLSLTTSYCIYKTKHYKVIRSAVFPPLMPLYFFAITQPQLMDQIIDLITVVLSSVIFTLFYTLHSHFFSSVIVPLIPADIELSNHIINTFQTSLTKSL